MRFLIVNGDDFGASRGINRGIIEAFDRGILTSTSLMVLGAASDQAAALGRAARGMSVGLHAELSPPTCPGRALALVRLRHDLHAQLARFEALMGRPPTHLDSHHNVHREPGALEVFLEIAHKRRLPLRDQPPVRSVTRFYAVWRGEAHLEQVGVDSLQRMLERDVGEGITELTCHPGYVDPDFRSTYSAPREVELRTLCDPRILETIADREITLVGYADVPRILADATP